MNLNCCIIDDEPLALGLLESYVQKTPFLTLCGKYNSALTAMQERSFENIDLLFLDIQMPELAEWNFPKCWEIRYGLSLPPLLNNML